MQGAIRMISAKNTKRPIGRVGSQSRILSQVLISTYIFLYLTHHAPCIA